MQLGPVPKALPLCCQGSRPALLPVTAAVQTCFLHFLSRSRWQHQKTKEDTCQHSSRPLPFPAFRSNTSYRTPRNRGVCTVSHGGGCSRETLPDRISFPHLGLRFWGLFICSFEGTKYALLINTCSVFLNCHSFSIRSFSSESPSSQSLWKGALSIGLAGWIHIESLLQKGS